MISCGDRVSLPRSISRSGQYQFAGRLEEGGGFVSFPSPLLFFGEILIGADKGGVGKTTVARTLLDYLRNHDVPTRAFDTEAPKGTLQRFHPDVSEVVDVTAVADQMRIFDTVSDSSVRSCS
jgi:hypothetical protein